MAANASHELASGSPCCLAWQGKYLGMKKRRDACKEAIEILQKAMGIANDEQANLQKKLREMVDNTDTKENVSVVKASLEKEISDLKSEILSLQQKLEQNLQAKSEEIKFLHDQTCSGEKEIGELKKLLKKETLRADNSEEEREQICKELNRTKALLVKHKDFKTHDAKVESEISLVKNLLASQRQETESERKKAESEKKKADQYLSELGVLRTTAHKTSSDLLTLTSNLEAVKKQLESEKQKTLRERKRADMESAKAREQLKLAEGLSKKFEIIRTRNEELKKEAELQSASSKVKFAENSAKLEEKIRLLEINQKSAMNWKSRADDLTQQLQESQLVTEGLKKQVQELSLSQNSAQNLSVSPQKARDLDKAKVRLLKKELKFERKCAKHSKRVAEFEKILREFQAEEIVGLKLKFGSLTNRMSLLGEYFTRDVEGSTALAKAEGRMKMQMLESHNNRSGKNHSDARCQLVASSGSQEEAHKLSTQLIAKSKQGVRESVSGTISQLESPTGGSRKLQTSQVISSKTSFSDRQLLASQGTEKFTVTTSAEIAKDRPNIQPTKSSKIDTRTKGNPCLMAENYLQRRQRDRHEVANEHFLKRKRMPEAVESRKHMCLSTAKGHGSVASFVEDVVAIDYMKLLELDNPEEEICYKRARESLLSPDLPKVDFLDGVDLNEEKDPATALDLVTSNSVELCDTIDSSEAPSGNTQNASVTVKRPPESTTLHGHILKHFVLFSNIEDQNSIITIFHAANNCNQRCPSVTRAQWAVPAILFSLKMEETLLPQERVCVFLSLLLHHFSAVSSMKTGNILDEDSCSFLDSFSKHIAGVMADTEAGGILSEFLEEILSLLQNLLSEQRVWYSAKSSETTESDLSIPVTMNGENVTLVNRIALLDHLVAGSAILAAICTAVDRVGFIREASFEILHKHCREKTSVPLTILHVFTHIAGEKMMSSSDHNISNAVLKSIVMFLEEKHFGTVEGNAKLYPGKNQCHFSDRSFSLEDIALMLMESVQEFTQSNTLNQSLTEFRPEYKKIQLVWARDQSLTLCDILSLVELIACYTEWDWTSENIVAPLLKMLGMPLSIYLTVAIVSLLGQLSSIGVDAAGGGFEHEGISTLREKLSAFLQCETTLKAGFAVQIATVCSLLKTLQLDFSTVFRGKTTMLPGCGDQSLSASANLVTKWFSLLSDEQRVFTTKILQFSVVK
ncbi:hypothetical protein F2Q70_00028358 [Brassica cretica]|uniref:Uncharacterized protein n=1 Tax=Brassica cretica TaxID=69181 RepID=A0A8S9LB03_BRACR|nr:hypothetical protein F2Q70_00028358 [Brassica cretica]